MPGTRTICGGTRCRSVTRSTWAMTRPPEFFAAWAIARTSVVRASRSRERLPCGVGGGGPNQGHVDAERRVAEVLLAVQLDQLDQILCGPGVQLPAVHPGVGEGAEADPGDRPGPVRGDVAEQVCHHALREAVGLDRVLGDQPAEAWSEAPVPADRPADHAGPGEVVEPSRLPVSRTGDEGEGEVPWLPRCQESPLQGRGQLLRHPHADEAAHGHSVTVEDHPHGVVRRDHLCCVPCPPASGRRACARPGPTASRAPAA